MSKLFRQEVIEAARTRWLGETRLATPMSHRILAYAAVSIAVGIVLFLVFGKYTRRARIGGTLVPVAGLIDVTALSASVVTHALVVQGQSVDAGQPLITLSGERSSSSFGETVAAVTEQLHNQRDRVLDSIKSQGLMAQEKDRLLRRGVALLSKQLTEIRNQSEVERRQSAMAKEMFQKAQPLAEKGYISVFRLKQLESAALEAASREIALNRQQLDATQQLSAREEELRELPLLNSLQDDELRRKTAEIDQALAQNEVARESILKAPQASVVSAVLIKDGQTVVSGQLLVTLLPKNSPVEAVFFVPSRSMGFVSADSAVKLHYEAFPYQKFGSHTGHIKSISQNAISPVQVSNILGRQVIEAMYRIGVSLDSQTIEIYGIPKPLRPGLAVDVDIALEEQRLISWIVSPFYRTTNASQAQTQ